MIIKASDQRFVQQKWNAILFAVKKTYAISAGYTISAKFSVAF